LYGLILKVLVNLSVCLFSRILKNMLDTYDIVLIGGGIVGVSTAWKLKQCYPDSAILLIEKESSLAHHQTGRNSGVIHAGVYYAPGSLKAEFCKRGSAQTIAFCQEHALPYEQCGKLLIATDVIEYERMKALEERCIQNKIEIERLSENELKKCEPNIKGLAALLVPATGITDFKKITLKMAERFAELGGAIQLDIEVKSRQVYRRLWRTNGRPTGKNDANRYRFSNRTFSWGILPTIAQA